MVRRATISKIFALKFIETRRRRARWNDRVVIAHFCVIEDALSRLHPIIVQRFFSVSREGRIAKSRHHLSHLGEIILRQIARISPRISQDLVLLVKRLGQLQRSSSVQTKTVIRLPLESR